MNDNVIKLSARERMLDAELAEALSIPEASKDRQTANGSIPRIASWRWSRVAIGLIAIGAVTAVNWLNDANYLVSQQQSTTFDAVAGPWRAWHTLQFQSHTVTKTEQLQTERARSITLGAGATPELFDAVLRQPQLEHLIISRDAEDVPWEAFDRHTQVHALSLFGRKLTSDQIRSLRALPNLTRLGVSFRGSELDQAAGQAIAELPKLRMLCVSGSATPAGVMELKNLPDLDTLAIGVPTRFHLDVIHSINRLPNLRALHLTELHGIKLEPNWLHALIKLPKLELLNLQDAKIGDAGIGALPTNLVALRLPNLTDVTPAGLARLARLKHLKRLGFSRILPEKLSTARAELTRALNLERLDCNYEWPDSKLWDALPQAGSLRRLTICRDGKEPLTADAIAPCKRIKQLTELDVRLTQVPQPQALQPLRNLPTLRIVRICIDVGRPGVVAPTAAQITALEQALGTDIQTVFVPYW